MIKKLIIILGVAFSVSAANACMVGMANITGIGVGANYDSAKAICYVDVEIETISFPIPQCKLYIQVGEEVKIPTKFSEAECPLDQVTVRGQLKNGGGGGYFFSGEIF